jgi:hypothetical protein
MKYALLFLITIVCIAPSVALPRFALMAGAKCASCHVNPTGGQMRNEYGVNFSTEKVPVEALKDSDFTFSSKLTDNISIGGDYRSQFIYDGKSKNSTFQAMTTTLYGAVTLSRKFTFYFKQDIINGSYNGLYGGIYNGTEVFGIAKILPGGGYIKGGEFLPDYGWRLDDHTAYTRGGDVGFTGAGYNPGLIFVPNYQDIGIEAGVYVEDLFITAGLFNGSGHDNPIKIPFDKEFAYTGKIECLTSFEPVNVRIGVSGYGYKSFHMGGVTLGFATGDIVVTGEMDLTHQRLNGTSVVENINAMAAYGEVDYRAMQGLWLVGKFDMFDPQQGRSDDPNGDPLNSIKRVTFGLEFFPFSFVEVRPQYRVTIETPSIDNDVALVQMHLWF